MQPVVGRNYVGGEWSAPRSDFPSTNPANLDEAVGHFPSGTVAEANQAVDAARAAFPAWRRTSRIHRADCFDRLAKLIERETDALAKLMARECGKNITECRAEVVEGLHMVQYVFGTGRMPVGDVIASEIPEKDAFVLRKPWGVAAVITPWNFPFAVPLWMLGPSLLEGNTTVFKPSEDTPAVGQRLVELFVEAGFPKGTINLVHGDAVAGEALVKNRGVNVVLFTGSYDVGKRIQQVSADFPDRIVAAEMGGKNAVIVCDDARFDLAMTAGILSGFKTTGQRCVSASRIIVHESLIDRYAARFVEVAKRLKFGDPLDPANFAGPVIHNASFDVGFLDNELSLVGGSHGRITDRAIITDTLEMARHRYPGQRNSLDALCRRLGVDNAHRQLHGALLDAQLLADVYLAMTSGQGEIGFDALAVQADADQADAAAEALASQAAAAGPRPRVMVSDEERAAHEARLDAIGKKLDKPVLWRALAG